MFFGSPSHGVSYVHENAMHTAVDLGERRRERHAYCIQCTSTHCVITRKIEKIRPIVLAETKPKHCVSCFGHSFNLTNGTRLRGQQIGENRQQTEDRRQ